MKRLHYSVKINAPKEKVWHVMLDKEGFKKWTSVFAEGSYYEGKWQESERIKFLTPSGEGMSSVVEEIKPYKYSSVKHLKGIKDGVEQTQDQSGFTYPAYENYTFIEENGSTIVKVEVDMADDYVDQMDELFPKALARLKKLCEEIISEKQYS